MLQIQPGKPTHTYIERFNRTSCTEVLDRYDFTSLDEPTSTSRCEACSTDAPYTQARAFAPPKGSSVRGIALLFLAVCGVSSAASPKLDPCSEDNIFRDAFEPILGSVRFVHGVGNTDQFGSEKAGLVEFEVERIGFGPAVKVDLVLDVERSTATTPQDFTLATFTASWAADTTGIRKFEVFIHDDQAYETEEFVHLRLGNATHGLKIACPDRASFDIDDDDLATVSNFGQLFDIPGVRLDDGSGVVEPRANNRTLYMHAFNYDQDFVRHDFVLQLDPGGPSHRWSSWASPPGEPLFRVQPGRKEEPVDTFDGFYADAQRFGRTGSISSTPLPGGFSVSPIALDYSHQSRVWIADSDGSLTTMRRETSDAGQFADVATLPVAVEYLEPDPAGNVWAVGGPKLFRVSADGQVASYDVSAWLENPATARIKKVRFSPAGAFLLAEDKIFRIVANLTLFHTIPTQFSPFEGKDFAVNAAHVFTSMGEVVHIDSRQVVANIIPPPPGPEASAEEIQEYGHRYAIFRGGSMEIGTDFFESRIYISSGKQILLVPQKLHPFQY